MEGGVRCQAAHHVGVCHADIRCALGRVVDKAFCARISGLRAGESRAEGLVTGANGGRGYE